ncbi:PREDICTED: uncharacterized protein LOC105110279 [Populus euphratica]|uniref:Uncharacterized protein LOC105110279 n=1 Tax=Populus euphratica TaxID=75702 RepID=A0AAJ6T3F6_POPEU|nr:PREDICTED: uncharacterized protein LOC105110279 [Populus euphratica]
MAFRSTVYWKWMTSRLRGNAHATSTSPERRVHAGPAADFGYLDLVEQGRKTSVKLLKPPNVRVIKKLRETIPEVVVPDKVVDEGKKFFEKSFYRKAAHVQEFEIGIQYMPNPICKDVYAHPLKAETLKSVGIEPQQL